MILAPAEEGSPPAPFWLSNIQDPRVSGAAVRSLARFMAREVVYGHRR
jgi:hypothetical protein